MSRMKTWILAVLVVIAFAGYLTIFGGGNSGECLSAFLYPDAEAPGLELAGQIGMTPAHVGGSRWGTENGKPILFIFDTTGRGLSAEVCMTGNVMNPDVEIIQP